MPPTESDFLRAFGERIRAERARRGMSRKLLADHAGISERYITQIESGKGNISILLLRQVAAALGLPLARLVEDEAPSPELTLVRQFLARLSPAQLREAHASLAARFASDAAVMRTGRIALVGLRGAGKNTLGSSPPPPRPSWPGAASRSSVSAEQGSPRPVAPSPGRGRYRAWSSLLRVDRRAR